MAQGDIGLLKHSAITFLFLMGGGGDLRSSVCIIVLENYSKLIFWEFLLSYSGTVPWYREWFEI